MSRHNNVTRGVTAGRTVCTRRYTGGKFNAHLNGRCQFSLGGCGTCFFYASGRSARIIGSFGSSLRCNLIRGNVARSPVLPRRLIKRMKRVLGFGHRRAAPGRGPCGRSSLLRARVVRLSDRFLVRGRCIRSHYSVRKRRGSTRSHVLGFALHGLPASFELCGISGYLTSLGGTDGSLQDPFHVDYGFQVRGANGRGITGRGGVHALGG